MTKIILAAIVGTLAYASTIGGLEFNIVLNAILVIALSHLVILQSLELRRIRDNLTTRRWALFALFIIALFSLIPIIVSQYLKLVGQPSDLLIDISTVLSPIQRSCTIGIVWWLYTSRIKEL